MKSFPSLRQNEVIIGLIALLVLVLLHPLLLEAFGQEHPPNCPVYVHFSAEFGIH